MKIHGQWSDGEAMHLEEGQRWTDILNGEPDIVIVSATEEETKFKTGDYEVESQETRGSDGFIDFLETCGYELK